MFEARFVATQDERLAHVPRVLVGLTDRNPPIVVINVLVENAGQPVFTIGVCGNDQDYFFKEDALIWNGRIVVGVGHQVTFISLADHTSTTTDLGCYFAYLYAKRDLLLVASAWYLHCFEGNGYLRWISQPLGIDGVVVEQIGETSVSGLGEWDPPSGWKPFKLSLATGQLLP